MVFKGMFRKLKGQSKIKIEKSEYDWFLAVKEQPSRLATLPLRFKTHKLSLEAVKQDASLFKFVYCRDEEMILTVLKEAPHLIYQLPQPLLSGEMESYQKKEMLGLSYQQSRCFFRLNPNEEKCSYYRHLEGVLKRQEEKGEVKHGSTATFKTRRN